VTQFKWVGVAVVVVVGLVVPSAAVAAEPADGLQIGMVQGMFRDVQPAMVQALSRPLRDLIRKQTGLTGAVEIVPDAGILADRMKAGRYHLGVYHGVEFAWAREQNPDLVPLVVTVPPGRKLNACVVVNADCKAKNLADLGPCCITVPRGTKAHCLLYLDRQRAGLPEAVAVPKAKPPVTPEHALDAVLSGESPAALVDIAALVGYQNLQPGAAQQLRVLCQSENFPQTVVAYSRGAVDDDTLARVRKLLTEAHTTAAGKPLMMLWNLKGFEDVPGDYDVQLKKIFKAYPPPTQPAQKLGPPITRTSGDGQ
jgi:ABC-type phosphate/phosphonate transport system substrate-binding protein